MSTKSPKSKSTKAERLAQLREEGLSHIEAEIRIAQEDAEAKIATLKARQAREEKRIRELMLTILEEEHSDEFDALRQRAVQRREEDAKSRSARIKGASQTASPASLPQGHGQSTDPREDAL